MQVQWHTRVIPDSCDTEREDSKFKASLGNLASHGFNGGIVGGGMAHKDGDTGQYPHRLLHIYQVHSLPGH